MKNRSLNYLFAFAALTSGCTRVINLKLDNVSGQLDIEANITNLDSPQVIYLRNNVAFSGSNTYPSVTGANVTVSDEVGNQYVFTETQPGSYTSPAFAGISGTAYTLQATVSGQTYTATSTMPTVVHMDSLTDKNRPLNRHQDGRDQKVISVYYQDRPGIANQYRFIERVNGIQVKSVFTYEDQLTDGRYVTFDLLEQDIDIYIGDVVTVEMDCIDEPIYTYWFALESQQANNFNGAVAPANPPTNITPAVLGYFSAHTSQTITYTVK
jgi:Domain of unknown function (DUF4249)